jgi:hypothetical protein
MGEIQHERSGSEGQGGEQMNGRRESDRSHKWKSIVIAVMLVIIVSMALSAVLFADRVWQNAQVRLNEAAAEIAHLKAQMDAVNARGERNRVLNCEQSWKLDMVLRAQKIKVQTHPFCDDLDFDARR